MKNYINRILVLLICLMQFGACKRFVEIPPPNNQIVSSTVFEDERTATATITGIYATMCEAPGRWASAGIPIYTGLCADEFVTQSAGLDRQFQENQVSPQNGTVANSFWNPAYSAIYTANLCIEKIAASKSLPNSVKKSLTGEALFVRAFTYFYLTNIFGDVPLVTSSDYAANATAARSPAGEIYKQILKDLSEAKQQLSNTYTGTERTRPNLQAVNALLARILLYQKDWSNAELISSEIINSGLYSLTPTSANVFLKTSNETIWQLASVASGRNTWTASLFVPVSAASVPQYKFRRDFLNSFEANDSRFNSWVGKRTYQGDSVYYPAKYKLLTAPPVNEHNIVFRLAEMYLIRAEVRARQGKLTEACADLNLIRNRAGLSTLTSNDATTVLSWIAQERKIELFAEWGDRWFDLKRTGKVISTISALKPSTWQNTDTLYPIPSSQLLRNPQLVQNNGY